VDLLVEDSAGVAELAVLAEGLPVIRGVEDDRALPNGLCRMKRTRSPMVLSWR